MKTGKLAYRGQGTIHDFTRTSINTKEKLNVVIQKSFFRTSLMDSFMPKIPIRILAILLTCQMDIRGDIFLEIIRLTQGK